MGEHGLWRVKFDIALKCAKFERITKEKESVYCQGMGKAATDRCFDTLYINGVIEGDRDSLTGC